MITLRQGNSGPAVKRLQEILSLLGFDAGPIKGVFGPSTRRLILDLQQIEGLCQDGIVGPQTWGRILDKIEDTRSLFKISETGLHDLRGLHPSPKNFGWLRDWSAIKGITLHQTGCEMPSRPLGWSHVNAHYGVTREGLPLLLNDPRDMIWHAQRLSKSTIGIEIEGNYEGLYRKRGTLWEPGGGPHYLTEAMIDAASVIFDDIRERLATAGQRAWCVFGHRQSSRTRRADPGEQIWREIAIP